MICVHTLGGARKMSLNKGENICVCLVNKSYGANLSVLRHIPDETEKYTCLSFESTASVVSSYIATQHMGILETRSKYINMYKYIKNGE
jgi:hypothetical protein